MASKQEFSNIDFPSEKASLPKLELVSTNFTRSFRMTFLTRDNEKCKFWPAAQQKRLNVTGELWYNATNQENAEQVLLTQDEEDCPELSKVKVLVVLEDWPDS